MLDMELSVEFLKLLIIKLVAIIDDDDSRKAKMTNDGVPYKFSDLDLGDLVY